MWQGDETSSLPVFEQTLASLSDNIQLTRLYQGAGSVSIAHSALRCCTAAPYPKCPSIRPPPLASYFRRSSSSLLRIVHPPASSLQLRDRSLISKGGKMAVLSAADAQFSFHDGDRHPWVVFPPQSRQRRRRPNGVRRGMC
uniref:Uncharacterized protein n=1 Tax=Pseudictyota dubia TaxID=2749911 RepID=A0A7R9WKB2_9STRA